VFLVAQELDIEGLVAAIAARGDSVAGLPQRAARRAPVGPIANVRAAAVPAWEEAAKVVTLPAFGVAAVAAKPAEQDLAAFALTAGTQGAVTTELVELEADGRTATTYRVAAGPALQVSAAEAGTGADLAELATDALTTTIDAFLVD
jgi:hypothetical protein